VFLLKHTEIIPFVVGGSPRSQYLVSFAKIYLVITCYRKRYEMVIVIFMYQYVSVCINMYQYVLFIHYTKLYHISAGQHISQCSNLCCGMPRVLRRNTQRHATVRLLEDSQPSCQGRGREYDADIEQIWQIGYIWIIHLCKIIARNPKQQ
jgi:hypothetical protein